MKRREYLAAALVGATAGCLRLTNETTETATMAPSTATDRPQTGSTTDTADGGPTNSEAEDAESTDGQGAVARFDVAWTHEDAGLDVNFRPDALVADDDELLAFGPQVARVDPSEPATLARTARPDGNVGLVSVQSTAVADDVCYVGYRSDPVQVVRVAHDASAVEWRFEADANLEDVSALAVHDGVVYAGTRARQTSGRATLYALDATSGEVLFSHEYAEDHEITTASVHDDVVFLGIDGDDPYPNAVDTTSRELFDTAIEYGVAAGRLVNATADALFVVDDQTLVAREWESFDVRFEQSLYDYPTRPPALHDGVLYLSNDPGVRAFDPESGEERWLARTTARVRRPPTFDGDGVAFVGDDEGILYALDAKSGEIRHEAAPFEYHLADQVFVDGQLVAAMNGLRGLDVVRE
ncbi:PQQ-binding-like beta-propeller repeat protein [Halorubellus sp. JP-L1]|uniref:outer membrane protein assembly factor BamB family protein n=1 Tax=Halorubellus sp. JP-L1 TaxID=2715753 RepID=UPI00140CCD6D|nr:PQQ-binding-like beta-propeller repeat protein [Halorubellus sp. JP-L1]NHN41359.1 PQQ-binding-like beta-propeller repeat protein [Halorubellus sp. JP-L1]